MRIYNNAYDWGVWLLFGVLLVTFVACNTAEEGVNSAEDGVYQLSTREAVSLDGRSLRVVATTSIIGDVVAQVGGDAISLTTLMRENQDPHSYQATPQDLVALEQADVIFVNGWALEEQLAVDIAENFAQQRVPISAGITPRLWDEDGQDHDHDHDAAADPHVWFSIQNVEQWTHNIADTLIQADPDNRTTYEANRDVYIEALADLATDVDEALRAIPAERRKLVTNHDSLAYFAVEYGFEVVGTVIPAVSTSAEPSASDLSTLVELMVAENVCVLFAESTQKAVFAEAIAAELHHCESVQLLSLYTGALGEGDAGSYIGMYRANVDTIVRGFGGG